MKKYVIASDIGASSGKSGLYEYNGNKVSLANKIDFDNIPLQLGPSLYWDFFALYKSVIGSFQNLSTSFEISSIGIDTWGATFGFLDKKGNLAESIFHYRDLRTLTALQDMEKICSKRDIFELTGCQPARSYSLPQFFSLSDTKDEVLNYASKALFLPDLFTYFLTGDTSSELTFAGTTALLDIRKNEWCSDLLCKFSIPQSLFTNLVDAGTFKEPLTQQAAIQCGLSTQTKVVAVCSHDTASAVAGIPNFDDKSVYVSIGTNINMGIECESPVITEQTFSNGLKNTGGFNRTNLLYKDFGAFWFINKLREVWQTEGKQYTFDQIDNMAKLSTNKGFFDLDDITITTEGGDIRKKINAFLLKTGQKEIYDDAHFVTCIYESIVLKIMDTITAYNTIFSNRYKKVYVINGGAKNTYLCQLIANSVQLPVYAGNYSASLQGNALVQLYTLGEVSTAEQLRELSARSCEMSEFFPQATSYWNEIFNSNLMRFVLNKSNA